MEDEYTGVIARRFCPWCSRPVYYGGSGRPRTFCSDKCRWAFDKYRQRHREVFDENARVKDDSGIRTETCGLQSEEETETGR